MPRLLGKDFAKVVFPKLRTDMNIWYETMPTSAVESWKQYLHTADQNESSHGNSPTCSIHLLKTARARWSVAMQFAPGSAGVISSSGVVVKSKNMRWFYLATSKL